MWQKRGEGEGERDDESWRKLEKAFLQLEKDYEKIPDSLRSDIANILCLIASLKDDNAALWSQIVELKGTVSNHEEVIKKLLESVTELNAKLDRMREMEDTICLRQAAFAVQEKLLREIGGQDLDSLWRTHYVRTLNDVYRMHGPTIQELRRAMGPG